MKKYLLGALAVLAVLALAVVLNRGPQTRIVTPNTDISIEVATSFGAGEAIEGQVIFSSNPQEASLILETSLGAFSQDLDASSGVGEFSFEGTRATAGQIRLVVISSLGTTSATVEVIAGDPVEVLPSFVGQRTIQVGGRQDSMVVVIPIDAYANPVADGTPVVFEILRPTGQSTQTRDQVSDLLAYHVFDSESIAAYSTVISNSGESVSANQRVLEVPASAAQVEIVPLATALPNADGFSVTSVNTATLLDQFDNRLLDGQSASALLSGPAGSSRFSAQIINGIASFPIPAPSLPGTYSLSISVGSTVSDTVELEFNPAVTDFDVELTSQTNVLTIGPVSNVSGSLVVDGTPVIIKLEDGTERAVQLVDGLAALELTEVVPTEVIILGQSEVVS